MKLQMRKSKKWGYTNFWIYIPTEIIQIKRLKVDAPLIIECVKPSLIGSLLAVKNHIVMRKAKNKWEANSRVREDMDMNDYPRYSLYIPKDIIAALGWKQGIELNIVLQNSKVVIKEL
jgi:hypothetical protein